MSGGVCSEKINAVYFALYIMKCTRPVVGCGGGTSNSEMLHSGVPGGRGLLALKRR